MADPPFLCPRCLITDAADRANDRNGLNCTRCQGIPNYNLVLVANDGRSAMSLKLFERLARPRSISPTHATVNNITREQFETWVRPSWRHIISTTTAKLDTTLYEIYSWEDVVDLCGFETVSLGTNCPGQAKRNFRGNRAGTIGAIVPPLAIKHTIKYLTPSNPSAIIEKVWIEFHTGIVHEDLEGFQLATNFPDYRDALYPHGAKKYITEKVRQSLIAIDSLRVNACKYTIENVRTWEEHFENV